MTWIIGTMIGLIGIAATIIIGIHQERFPVLSAWCKLPEDGDPCALICFVKNSGTAEARDVFVSFNNMLLLDTKALASPELGITLVESYNLPNPERNPEAAKLEKAFAVHIPRIAKNDTIMFELITSNPDNQRTGKQTLRILNTIANLLFECHERLSNTHPAEAKIWNIEALITYHFKYENFFSPSQLSYEKGRQPIDLFADEERLAAAYREDIFNRYDGEFKDLYQDLPDFVGPVIRIKTADGDSTYARCPPYVRCHVTVSFFLKEKPKKGTVLDIPLTVPDSY